MKEDIKFFSEVSTSSLYNVSVNFDLSNPFVELLQGVLNLLSYISMLYKNAQTPYRVTKKILRRCS